MKLLLPELWKHLETRKQQEQDRQIKTATRATETPEETRKQ